MARKLDRAAASFVLAQIATLLVLGCSRAEGSWNTAQGAEQGKSKRDPALRQFDNVIYKLPAGWFVGGRNGYLALMPRDHDKEGFCTIWIAPSEKAPSDPAKWIRSKMAGVVEKGDQASAIREPKGTKLGPHSAWMAGQAVDGDMQIHVAVVAAGRIEHIYFNGPADEKGQRATNSAFIPLCDELQFVSAGAKPLLEAPRPGEFHGSYFGTGMGYGLNGIEVENKFFFFTKAGHFYEGVPSGRSLQTIDFPAAFAREGGRCGNYHVRGKELVLDFGNGEKRSKSFKQDGDALVIGGDKFWLQEEIADGTHMDGCWTSLHYSSFTQGSGVVGGAGGTHSLTLTKDGKFQSEGMGFASANFETPAGDLTGGFSTKSDNKAKQGTYEFKGGVLVLNASDGTRRTKNLFMLSPRVMLLDGTSHIDQSKPESDSKGKR